MWCCTVGQAGGFCSCCPFLFCLLVFHEAPAVFGLKGVWLWFGSETIGIAAPTQDMYEIPWRATRGGILVAPMCCVALEEVDLRHDSSVTSPPVLNKVRDHRGERLRDPAHLRLGDGVQPREGLLQAEEGTVTKCSESSQDGKRRFLAAFSGSQRRMSRGEPFRRRWIARTKPQVLKSMVACVGWKRRAHSTPD